MNWWSCFLLTCVCFSSVTAWAQFRLDIERVALGEYDEETIDTGSVQEIFAQGRVRANVVLNLNNMIFNQHRTPENAKKHFHDELRKWLDVADAGLELTADERAKLWLAGSSDIERFFSDADEINSALALGINGQGGNKWRQQLMELQTRVKKGICSEGSMLAKVADRTFAKERRTKAAKLSAVRRRYAHEATAKLVIAEIEKTMPLTIEQRKRMLDILLKHEPQQKVDHRTYYAHALARLRDKAVEALIEPNQKRRWRAALSNAKNRKRNPEAAIQMNFGIELK